MKQSLDEILEEIGRSSLLTHEEELALLKVVQEKGTDCDEMKQLEKANMRFVVSVANQYQKRGLTLEELIEAGTEGLRRAAVKLDTPAALNDYPKEFTSLIEDCSSSEIESILKIAKEVKASIRKGKLEY